MRDLMLMDDGLGQAIGQNVLARAENDSQRSQPRQGFSSSSESRLINF